MIPMMMSWPYKANGWLGMILGTHLWYGFFGDTLDIDEKFDQKIKEMCSAIDAFRPEPAEEPEPPPEPTPAPAPAPAPAPKAKAKGPQDVPITAGGASRPAPGNAATAVAPAPAPAVAVSSQALVTMPQVQALEARLDALEEAGLLSAEEAELAEDILADFVVFRQSIAPLPITAEVIRASAAACALHTMLGLAEAFAVDRKFARQLRRQVLR